MTICRLKQYSAVGCREGLLLLELLEALLSVSQSIIGSTPTSLRSLGIDKGSLVEFDVVGRDWGTSISLLNTFSGGRGQKTGLATFAGKRDAECLWP
jgi:hypothetical protein